MWQACSCKAGSFKTALDLIDVNKAASKAARVDQTTTKASI
jgi:hypothetical protein